MGFDRTAPKRPVNMNLNEDLVRQASGLTSNFSETSDVGPHFVVEGKEVAFDALQITNLPRGALGPSVGSLAEEDDRVVRALDILLSRAWPTPEAER